jgi:tRNA (guanine37-N1)-methyltransferase
VGEESPCTILVSARQCGELARRRLSGARERGAKPTTLPLRVRLPAFPASERTTALSVRESLLSECAGLIEAIEAACARAESVEPPVSYVLVGPVAIVSLDDRVRGREEEVARALLRLPGVKAVYGKEATEGEFRVQRLIHLAGARFEEVTYKEHGLEIPLPLGKVYINPRLAAEHMRVARLVGYDELLLDMFAGWGGFSLAISMLGKARLIVANDANPWAIVTLARALERNRGKLKTPIIPVMADASMLPQILKPVFTRIIMNLPHRSLDFLPIALKLCSRERGCRIHVYIVASGAEEAVKSVNVGSVEGVTRVLDYAPHRYVFRVDVRVPAESLSTV